MTQEEKPGDNKSIWNMKHVHIHKYVINKSHVRYLFYFLISKNWFGAFASQESIDYDITTRRRSAPAGRLFVCLFIYLHCNNYCHIWRVIIKPGVAPIQSWKASTSITCVMTRHILKAASSDLTCLWWRWDRCGSVTGLHHKKKKSLPSTNTREKTMKVSNVQNSEWAAARACWGSTFIFSNL